jgi:hypothetical protein
MTPPTAWWIHPGKLALCFFVPLYLALVYLVPELWPSVILLKGPLYIRGSLAATGLVMLVLFGAGGLLGTHVAFRERELRGHTIDPFWLGLVGVLTVVAYAIWFFPVLLHGQLSVDRNDLNQTPGVTSFTQMGVPFVVCFLHCRLAGGQKFTPLLTGLLYSVLFLTIVRVFLWKERLALIEMGVPAALVILVHGTPQTNVGRVLRRAIARWGPYLAVPALLAVFTVTEYFRSWQTYSHTQSRSLFEFMTSRVVTYYFTALNNGAGLLATHEWPTFDFFFSANWLYHLPGGVGDALYTALIGYKNSPESSFLTTYGDPEFNNMSGIFPILCDVGTVGAGLYFSAFGLIAGMLHRSMRRGSRIGGMLYPPVFVGCLEVLRTPYLNSSRIVLLAFGTLLLLVQMRPRIPVTTRVPEGHDLETAPG